jgi:two-component system chemotaxis response regulator CheB
MGQYEVIVIGVSAGGTHALSTILPILSENFPMPVIIVQHHTVEFDNFWVKHLDKLCKLNVIEATSNDQIISGKIYIAPGGYHLMIERENVFSLSVDAPVCYSIPSIDVLFESAAYVYKEKLVGVILTGDNNDGSNGLKKIRELGGLTVVQDPKTADTRHMPENAINIAGADHILTLEDIGPFLMEISHVK